MPVVHVGRELHSEGIDLRDAGADHSGAGKQSAQCSSTGRRHGAAIEGQGQSPIAVLCDCEAAGDLILNDIDAIILQGHRAAVAKADLDIKLIAQCGQRRITAVEERSEEHTSELQSLMRNSYAVFCLKKKIYIKRTTT